MPYKGLWPLKPSKPMGRWRKRSIRLKQYLGWLNQAEKTLDRYGVPTFVPTKAVMGTMPSNTVPYRMEWLLRQMKRRLERAEGKPFKVRIGARTRQMNEPVPEISEEL